MTILDALLDSPVLAALLIIVLVGIIMGPIEEARRAKMTREECEQEDRDMQPW